MLAAPPPPEFRLPTATSDAPPPATPVVRGATAARARRAIPALLAVLLTLAMLHLAGRGMPVGDLAARLVLLGGLLPLAAWLACRGVPAAAPPAAWQRREAWVMLALLALVVVGLGPVKQLLLSLAPARGTPGGEAANTAYKLLLFVVLPGFVLHAAGLLSAGARSRLRPAQALRIVLLLGAVAFALQAAIGREFQRWLASDPAPTLWLWAVPACWAWMSIEAGLVEEFFFRRWLQSRLEAWTGSALSGLLLAAAIFGLAHAPGLWLRGGGLVEGLGSQPGLLDCLAYTLVTQGLAGLMFGLLWQRTRSLALCVAVHGLFDVPAHLARFVAVWGA